MSRHFAGPLDELVGLYYLGNEMNVTKEMVDRFLTWPVPAEVYPDGTPGQPGRTGTNLLTATQAQAMLEHVLSVADCYYTDAEHKRLINCVLD